MSCEQTRKAMNKLVKILPSRNVKCDTCETTEIDHMHFLLAEGLLADPASVMPRIEALFCNNCHADAKLKRCTACQIVAYCSRSCQAQDWSKHAAECNSSIMQTIMASTDVSMQELNVSQPLESTMCVNGSSNAEITDSGYKGNSVIISSPPEEKKARIELPKTAVIQKPRPMDSVQLKPSPIVAPAQVEQPKSVEAVLNGVAKELVNVAAKITSPTSSKVEPLVPYIPSYAKSSLKIGAEYGEAGISYSFNPSDFYIHADLSVADQAYELTVAITTLSETPNLAPCSKGSIIGAKFTDDGAWYRAVVLEKQQDKCLVKFIDYGNNDTVAITDMVALSKEILDVPALAIHCILKDVAPKSDDQYSAEAIDQFSDLTTAFSKLVVLAQNNDAFVVDWIDSEGKHITTALLEKGLIAVAKPSAKESGDTVVMLLNRRSVPTLANATPQHETPPSSLGGKLTAQRSLIQKEPTWIFDHLKKGDSFFGAVTFVFQHDPVLKCYIVLDVTKYTELTSALEKTYKDSIGQEFGSFAVGDYTCVEMLANTSYFRALVLEVNSAGYKVLLVDSGQVETVKGNIVPLPSHYLDEPVCGALASAASKIDLEITGKAIPADGRILELSPIAYIGVTIANLKKKLRVDRLTPTLLKELIQI